MNSEQSDSLFIPASFFMIRAPLLPIEEFFHLCKQGDDYPLEFYKNNARVREAIAIASPSLSKAIANIKNKNLNERKQILSSLLKYLLRMTSRSTPFGLFAFVAMGSWNLCTSVSFDINQICKRARPDMEWLLKVVDGLCDDTYNSTSLQIRKNPLLFSSGKRVILNYVRKRGEGEEKKTSSIRSTILTKTIFELAHKPVGLTQLEKSILERLPSVEKEKVKDVIKQLLVQEYLLVDLQPSLLTLSPFQDLQEKLSKFSHDLAQSKQFEILSKKLFHYNQHPIGQGENLFQEIQTHMERVAFTSHFLQVDAAYKKGGLTLSKKVADELGEVAEILWKLSYYYQEKSPLYQYHLKFLEKYGTCRRIPLLEVLSDGGIGIPDNYREKASEISRIHENQLRWKKWLKNEWCTCVQSGKKEIILTKELIEKYLNEGINKEKALVSFDLFCEVVANSSENIDQGKFLLALSGNTWQAGSTFGRFIDILGEDAHQSLKDFFSEEENLEQGNFFVETSYLSSSSRNANVTIHPNLRQHYIDLGGNNSTGKIELQDVYVGATSERLYLTTRGGGEELIALSGNVLNNNLAPLPLRFIRDVSTFRHRLIYPFLWEGLEDLPYLPRIQYKKSILSASQWKVDLSSIKSDIPDTLEVIKEKFLSWATKWGIPRYLYMTLGDVRVLLDIHNSSHIHEIAVKLKKNEEIRLVEKINQDMGQWVKSQDGHHLSEIVVPFLKNSKYHPPIQNTFHSRDSSISPANRWRLIGSEWLFLKIYLPIENEVHFLEYHTRQFSGCQHQQGIIKGWFFVRYRDPLPHIRIRFWGEPDKLIESLIPALHQWLISHLQNQLIQDFQIGAYEREIERYGGEELIEFAENLFCEDTQTTVHLLRAIAERKLTIPNYAIAALSLIDLLKNFRLNAKEQIIFLHSSELNKEELKGFRQSKKFLLEMGNFLLNHPEHSFSNVEYTLLFEAFQKRKQAQSLYFDNILELQKRNILSNSIESIEDSILHMHCNRLLGNDLQLERKARVYALHTLRNLGNFGMVQKQPKSGDTRRSRNCPHLS